MSDMVLQVGITPIKTEWETVINLRVQGIHKARGKKTLNNTLQNFHPLSRTQGKKMAGDIKVDEG